MAHRRRAVTPEQFQIVRKAVASTADVASTGKLAPLQGEVASAIHDMFPPKKKKPGAEELETTPQLPTTGSEATAPMSAAKSKEKSMQKVARKKVDPDSVEGRALSAYVQMMMDEEDDEEDVEKRVDQPRDADGKFAPEGSGSDTADHANPFIKPSGKPSPLASAPKADHAAYHAGELVHYLKQQIAAYHAGDVKSGDAIGKIVSMHNELFQHYSGINMVKSMDGDVEVEKSVSDWIQMATDARGQVAPHPAAIVEVQKKLYCEFIMKAMEPDKQLVFGIVLIPEVVDLQGDIYDAAVIENAAHTFLAKYNNGTKLGHIHKNFNSPLSLVESYIAPTDMVVDGKSIVKGTWLMTVKVNDATLWNDVKEKKLAGFSIGGTAKVMKLDA